MEVIVVPDGGLVRPAGRLAAAIGLVHDAILLGVQELAASQPPGGNVGVIHLADVLPAHLGNPDPTAHGIRWGTAGNEAWVSSVPVGDPQATLDAMGSEIAEIQSRAKGSLARLGPSPAPADLTGLHLAGMYLDPKLRVPAQTVAGGGFAFTPERMCWERQYTLGIVQFLERGFDEWAEAVSG